MTSSLILAWVAVLLVIFTALKYVARKSKSVKLNRFFHKIHIPAGITMVCVALFHGIIAGNVMGTKLQDASMCSVLFSLNWGTACFIVSVLLGISYMLRKILKKNWMRIHRILTVVLLVLVVVHIIDVGIQLPSRIIAGTSKTDHSIDSDIDNIAENIDLSQFAGVQLKDGVYEGSAYGYKSLIKVSVTVNNSHVEDIQILEQNETIQYFNRATSITDDIINNQSLNVDAVSGATYSSKGIINAVKNALQSAVTDGELENTDNVPEIQESIEHSGERKQKKIQKGNN